eukprot:TRINITY_DN45767_c0_g1_i1.p1 TRINITY_DN45767_c0_g1~~TRINITY_DN45767_c0_g1_i1.p1  ORF type:complete len:885 (+),score=178.43 TRINITY_DN45767_c0_g1_i1:125-2779(+)
MPTELRLGKATSLPPWGVVHGPDEARLQQKPGKAEEDLQRAVQHGKWERLGPQCRLWLLRAFAVEHSRWTEFTPRCQIWVLHELGLLLADERHKALEASSQLGAQTFRDELDERSFNRERGDFAAAIERTRLPRLVKADPQRSRQLVDICNDSFSLSKIVSAMQAEIDAHSNRGMRAAQQELIRSPSSCSLPHVSSMGSRMCRTATTPAGSPKGGARSLRHCMSESALGSRQSPSSPINSSHHAHARDRSQAPGESKRASSKPSAAESTRPPPRRMTVKPSVEELAMLDGFGAAGGVSGGGSDDAVGTGSAMGAGVAGGQRAKAPIPVDPEAPRVVRSGDDTADLSSPSKTTTFCLLPMKSEAWRKIAAEEERKRIVSVDLVATLQHLHEEETRLEGLQALPAASVIMKIPQAATHISALTKCVAPFDSEAQKGEAVGGRTAYLVRIHGAESVACVNLVIAEAFRNLKDWESETVWPFERVQEEIARKFPEACDLSAEQLKELAGLIEECCKMYTEAWDIAKKSEPKEVDRLLAHQSLSTFEGLLLTVVEARQRQLREDPACHSARGLSSVMADAAEAQAQLKRALAPGTEWALLDLNDVEAVPLDDQVRTLPSSGKDKPEDLVPGGHCCDPGISSSQAVSERARLKQMVFEKEPPFHLVSDVSRLTVTFEQLAWMNIAFDRILERLDVVWVRNHFRSPSCIGWRGIIIGVRQRLVEPEEAAASAAQVIREHVTELRLLFQPLQATDEGPAERYREAISQKLVNFGVKEEIVDGVRDNILEAMEFTEGCLRVRPSLEIRRLVEHVRRLSSDISEHDIPVVQDIVVKLADVARLGGVVESQVDLEVALSQMTEKGAVEAEAEVRRKALEAHRRLLEAAAKEEEEG